MRWRTVGALLAAAMAFRMEAGVRVVGVTDGDTIVVTAGRTTEKIRLWGIDSPEMGQPFGKAAKHFTSEACFGRTVTLEERGRDRYGRTLAIVRLSDGRSLNEMLVGEGMAWWYYSFAPKALELSALEREARRRRIGLWAAEEPVPPWSWRKLKRHSGT
jgi:endonuclease YncB( thermonuclease family)